MTTVKVEHSGSSTDKVWDIAIYEEGEISRVDLNLNYTDPKLAQKHARQIRKALEPLKAEPSKPRKHKKHRLQEGDFVTVQGATMRGEVLCIVPLYYLLSDGKSRAQVYVQWESGSIGKHPEASLVLCAK